MTRGALLFAAAALGFAGVASVRALPSSVVQDATIQSDDLPRSLAVFGFFRDAGAREPSPGVVPYRLNTPLYSDGAEKLRYIYLPDGAQAIADGEGLLQFPVGTAIIKTFAFPEGDGLRYIETRVLLHRTDGWIALPYRWNEEQTEARLALAGGRTEVITPAGETLSYRIPNKNQCKECHGLEDAVVPIGPKARNLSAEWIAAYHAEGRLDAIPAIARRLPIWGNRASAPVDQVARAYLDVNCAHCHRPGAGASNSGLDLRWEQDDPHKIGIMKRPVAAGRGSGGYLFDIVPGKPEQSILVHRMNSDEPGVAMPELGKSTVDQDGVAAIERWVAEMGR